MVHHFVASNDSILGVFPLRFATPHSQLVSCAYVRCRRQGCGGQGLMPAPCSWSPGQCLLAEAVMMACRQPQTHSAVSNNHSCFLANWGMGCVTAVLDHAQLILKVNFNVWDSRCLRFLPLTSGIRSLRKVSTQQGEACLPSSHPPLQRRDLTFWSESTGCQVQTPLC